MDIGAWPAATAGFALGYGLYGIVVGFIFGELLAIAVALVMLNRSEKNHPLQSFGRFATFIAGAIGVVGWTYAVGRPSIIAFCGLSVLSLALIAWIVRAEIVTIRNTLLMARRLIVRGA
jgi:hypothetical protein